MITVQVKLVFGTFEKLVPETLGSLNMLESY